MGLKDELGGISASIAAKRAAQREVAQPTVAGGEVVAESPAAAPLVPASGPRSPRTAPGALFAFSEQSRQMERELDALKKAAGAPRMLKRSSLRASPFQVRPIQRAKVETLAANLRENDLASPIVVREISAGVFEMIAGHHRDAAFGLLDRDEIPGIVVDMSDDQAERAVFFDNFFPPETTDFEKYLGLKQIQLRHDYTHDQLAQRSGISRQLVGMLMSFERLPDAALTVLRGSPAMLGANAAAKLAQTDVKRIPRIAEGLQLVVDGKLNQAQLLDWVNEVQAAKRVDATVIKSGKAIYAKVVRRDGRLTVDFTNSEDAKSLEREIEGLIRERAKAVKH